MCYQVINGKGRGNLEVRIQDAETIWNLHPDVIFIPEIKLAGRKIFLERFLSHKLIEKGISRDNRRRLKDEMLKEKDEEYNELASYTRELHYFTLKFHSFSERFPTKKDKEKTITKSTPKPVDEKKKVTAKPVDKIIEEKKNSIDKSIKPTAKPIEKKEKPVEKKEINTRRIKPMGSPTYKEK